MNKKTFLLAVLPLLFLVAFLFPQVTLATPDGDCYAEANSQGYDGGACSDLGCDQSEVEISPNPCTAPDECCALIPTGPTQDEQNFCQSNASNSGYDSGTCRDTACLGDETDLGNCGDDPSNNCCGYEGVLTNSGTDATTGGTTGGGSYLVPDCAINDPASCGLCDLVQFIVDATQFLAGGVAAFALLFFIIGGFYWIFSAGNEQRIAQGKKIMIGSITGVVIVFLAWIIVNTVILTVSTGGEDFGGTAEIFPSAGPTTWFEVECSQYE
ncbi:pilin [Patescibacteria group bacterium]|nr:pilin [Patescibacteria group bacterium]MBU1672936.1 pilin [Patescibacteria group bacterium]MBU1963578.1 pilin [Patescibacteria group bacterium]MBU1963589.1 pilin [Patescibacteria group bacterium]